MYTASGNAGRKDPSMTSDVTTQLPSNEYENEAAQSNGARTKETPNTKKRNPQDSHEAPISKALAIMIPVPEQYSDEELQPG